MPCLNSNYTVSSNGSNCESSSDGTPESIAPTRHEGKLCSISMVKTSSVLENSELWMIAMSRKESKLKGN